MKMAPRGAGTKGCKKLRFFKFVFGDDHNKAMYLPPTIAQQVQHLAGRETEIEDARGARWQVTVSEINGSLAFKKGWQKFYSEHHLKKGELLYFKYIWKSHFAVRVFGLSACERVNFDSEMPRKSKRARRDPGPVIEEVQFPTVNINSGDKPVSDTTVVSKVGRSSVPMEDEAQFCIIKQEYGCYQEEDRSILGDLSIFEQQNVLLLPSPNKSQNVSKSHIGISEQVKTIVDDVQMDEVYTCQVEGHSCECLTKKLETPSYTKLAPSHPDTVDKTNKTGHDDDAEIGVIQTNQIKGHSGGVDPNTFKKAVETKPVPFHLDITKLAIEKGYDTQTAAINSSQTDFRHLKKPSEISNSRKGMFGVSLVQNEPFSGFPQTAAIHSSWSDMKHLKKPFESGNSRKGMCGIPSVQNEPFSGSPQTAAFHSIWTDMKHLNPFESSNSRKGMCGISSVQNGSFSGSSQTTAINSSQTDTKHLRNPSESSNSRKGMFDGSISSVQNGSFGGSAQTAAIDSSQTGTKHLRNPFESSNSRNGMFDGVFNIFSSPVAKEPPVKSAIKSEVTEIEARPFPQTSCDNHGQIKVKPEPQSYDDNPPPVAFTFSAEVKNNLYLELPAEVKSRRRGKKSSKVLYLKNSEGRIWPLLCPEKSGSKALCLNWTNFCQENNIKPGDECRFQFENEIPEIDIARVDVFPKI